MWWPSTLLGAKKVPWRSLAKRRPAAPMISCPVQTNYLILVVFAIHHPESNVRSRLVKEELCRSTLCSPSLGPKLYFWTSEVNERVAQLTHHDDSGVALYSEGAKTGGVWGLCPPEGQGMWNFCRFEHSQSFV